MVEVNSERWLDLKDLKGEVWRVVEDTEENGTFLISNYGRLKRMPFFGGRYHFPEMIFRVHESRENGYYKCRIGKKKYAIHRLVSMAFIPPKWGCNEVDHKNNNKKDNRARNLRWVTRKTNANNPVTKWDREQRRNCLMFNDRPELPRTQVNLKKYNPLICVSLGIFKPKYD